ncbi:hypothetical protein BB559_004696 [Furculomyces boomerangus]|uniref:NAD(P)-binding domain-containing protein n=2 Tax=Harpellales TaxID=61421 RepID=A0A2T9YD91_9FUNG|nr:hypothetical protein BB559_004696 [Furculomyces boomerangus]PWA03051.1 hypothetical protein BB558_000790 [Smittium angustum]
MSIPAKRIFVVGGTGFIGSEICRIAIQRGHDVISLSRRGSPTTNDEHVNKVKWIKGNVLNKETYSNELKSCDAVVHSMGILMENDYKKIVNIKPSDLIPKVNNGPDAQKTPENNKSNQYTYEIANRDSALTIADAAVGTNVKTFVYISACSAPPLIDKRYITTKREAEVGLAKHKEFKSVFLRPGIVYSYSRLVSLPFATGQYAINFLSRKTPLGCIIKKTFLKDFEIPPVSNTDVAIATIAAIESQAIEGVVDADEISKLGSTYF